MSGTREEGRGERSQTLPSGTGGVHERGKIKKSQKIRRSGGQGVDLKGPRSAKPIQMNDPDAGRHHRCADLPEAEGGGPADVVREVANGRKKRANAPDAKQRSFTNARGSWSKRCATADWKMPGSEADAILQWAVRAQVATRYELIERKR